MIRRDFLRRGSTGIAAALIPTAFEAHSLQAQAHKAATPATGNFNVRSFGAVGDGSTIDSPAINRAIEAAAAAGGGTVHFPAGTYASYTIRLKSHISLHLDAGATILAASVPNEGTTTGGYDAAGPAQPWEAYQDYGHNHWPNSLIYGDGLENVSIYGPGLIWGKGLSRGESGELPLAESPGVGNKAIALKNCRNVTLRDFSILMGGHFGVLLTAVDNVIIDGLTIDTNRDGIDIDCCRNVRVSNCAVNSPWDDAICPKSSFALGYARSTENVTISNCYVTGLYEFGTLLDGTFKRANYSQERKAVGRIKCGTESNGGFRNITITNCILEGCRGFALETVDGAYIEDITVTNLVLRGAVHAPIFLRLGTRMRGPKGVAPGVLRRVVLSNFTSIGSAAEYPSIVSGVPGVLVEDIKISDMYLSNLGGGTAEWAAMNPPELPGAYPEASMFGTLPARGFFLRHARNLELSNIEIATEKPDQRPAVWAHEVNGLDIFRLRMGRGTPAFALSNTRDFRSFGSRDAKDVMLDKTDRYTL
ncbi:glycoside hydrolase family 28 protein [Granulicella sp. WH15]|uniref:rhamnogalacturonidase n=1 Tax=Granulicella sp. WH15 TaxID=2602070 RepID=UPI001366AC10|nr:glycoside hydrolase family 28 protein [Granulicella sp. WH15]QHN04962.1 glycoside hydrolase family 28 protein [Granulicella sp. WH15]